MDLQSLIRQRVAAFNARFGTRIPVMNSPMAGVTTPAMAAAVSNAGGLGVLAGDLLEPAALAQEIDAVRALTTRPFAVNLRAPTKNQQIEDPTIAQVREALGDLMRDLDLDPQVALLPWPSFEEQLEVIIEKQVPVVTTSFGALREVWAEKLEAAGIAVMTAATTLREAKVVRAAGAGAVIVQGVEAGGPRLCFEDADSAGCVGLLSLIGPALRATKLPVVAAGGIATGTQMAAALVAGASAVQVGTALLRSAQSAACALYKESASFAVDSATVLTRIYSGRMERVLGNGLIEAIADSGMPLATYPAQQRLMVRINAAAVKAEREDLLYMPAGQGVQLAPAADAGAIVSSLARECADSLGLSWRVEK